MMLQTEARDGDDRARSHSPTGAFGWSWVWATLRLRRWQFAGLLALTITGYAAGLALPIVSQHAVDRIGAGHAGAELGWLAAAAVAAIMVEAAVTSRRQHLVIQLAGFLNRRMSRKAYLQLMRTRIDVDRPPTGDVLNRFQQADKVPEFVLELVPQVLFETGGGVVSLMLMFYYDPLIGAVTLGMTLSASLYLQRTLERMNTLADVHFAAYGERQTLLSESIHGLETIRILASEGRMLARWNVATDRVIVALQRQLDQLRRFSVGSEVITGTVSVVVLSLGCYRIMTHELSFGELLALQLLAARVVAPLLTSGEFFRHLQDVQVAMTEFSRFMAEPREQAERRPPLRALGRGGIAVTDLTLTYPGAPRPALDHVGFVLPPTGLIAVVGRNGSGKSSLIRVLLGLQRDYLGEVMIGGANLRDYDPRWLRAQIGIANQDTTLFSGTIAENLSGHADADAAAIGDAVALARAGDVISALPDGLDTRLEENGRNLSGGQRQRLAIARAVLRRPRLLVLDEPSASLDAEAAIAIEQSLASWRHDHLVLLVTHHLSAARHADAILVLDGGRLAGLGPHAQLLDSCSCYASLWSDYLRSVDGAPQEGP